MEGRSRIEDESQGFKNGRRRRDSGDNGGERVDREAPHKHGEKGREEEGENERFVRSDAIPEFFARFTYSNKNRHLLSRTAKARTKNKLAV